MPLGSVICRKKLDQEGGNPWVCECPLCRVERKETQGDVKEGTGDDRSDPSIAEIQTK